MKLAILPFMGWKGGRSCRIAFGFFARRGGVLDGSERRKGLVCGGGLKLIKLRLRFC